MLLHLSQRLQYKPFKTQKYTYIFHENIDTFLDFFQSYQLVNYSAVNTWTAAKRAFEIFSFSSSNCLHAVNTFTSLISCK